MSSGVNGQFYGLSALWSYLSGYKKIWYHITISYGCEIVHVLNCDGYEIALLNNATCRWEIRRWGSTPEPPKFPLPQFQPGNQRIQVNNFTAALEGIMSVQQNVLPGHRRYPGQRLNAPVVAFCFQPLQ